MSNRKHPWDVIDPILLEKKMKMTDVARKWKIPYRQVTNRYYAIRNKQSQEKGRRSVKKP